MRRLLIIDADAEHYRDALADITGVTLAAVRHRDEIKGEELDAEAILAFGSALDEALIARSPRLEWVQSLSSGTDRIEALLRERPEVRITSTTGVHGPPVSEMAFTHMLALSRNLPALIRNQAAAIWEKRPQPLLHGKTAVILGTGTIAQALAQRCRAFEMRVVGVSRTPRRIDGFDQVIAMARLTEAAALADFLVVLVPLSDETRGLVDEKVLAAMRPSAFLVNLARGGVVDEDALLQVLRAGRIAGAGLDVFAAEPLPVESPLWREERVLITPHIAGVSDRYADLVMPIIRSNLHDFVLSGSKLFRNEVR